ncbi:MAG: hypothetical protein FWB71_01740, partial [Defluviitaleaceae bacterium]|nr:hypothetical protein [Defluviitaleaceae bacterium]
MKPSAYKFFFLALFCATALLSSCARSEGNLASQYEECIFLEDLDAMFSIINDSFPFANMAERMLGINMENKMTQTRAYFENRSFSDANDFFEALSNNFFAPFQFLGHLSLMDAPLFHAHLAVFPPESTWVKILDNPKSRGFYADAPEGLFSPDAGGSPTPNNIATNSIQY